MLPTFHQWKVAKARSLPLHCPFVEEVVSEAPCAHTPIYCLGWDTWRDVDALIWTCWRIFLHHSSFYLSEGSASGHPGCGQWRSISVPSQGTGLHAQPVVVPWDAAPWLTLWEHQYTHRSMHVPGAVRQHEQTRNRTPISPEGPGTLVIDWFCLWIVYHKHWCQIRVDSFSDFHLENSRIRMFYQNIYLKKKKISIHRKLIT